MTRPKIVECVKPDSAGSVCLTTSKLPPKVMDRAVTGMCWVVSLILVTQILINAMGRVLQPEYAQAWSHPALRLASLIGFFLSLGVMVVHRKGWLRKERLLDLGLFYQVAIAFTCGLFEAAAYTNPNTLVMGYSAIATWMLLCGLLMPQAPLRAAFSAGLCVLMWPLAYWVDLQIFGFQAMPVKRLLAWTLPLVIVGIWMYILNNRVIASYYRQQRMEDIGSYTLESRLGLGGMGEVWRAKHKMLARDAAIKLIRPEMLQGSTGRQEVLLRKRFEREAQVTASLRSPHTVALYDFGQAKDGSFYYVMELLDGIDLQTLVDRYGPLHPGRVRNILFQISNSLDEAHMSGLIHRDIKPRNLILCKLGLEYDFAKVLDFGLVKSLHPERAESMLTMDGVTTGTPAYLSPEMALGNSDMDGRADLYSLGCVAYFLLTGGMVFEESSPTAFAIAHVQKRPIPMSQRSELPVPAGLEAIVMQLLEKSPADRIQTAHELGRRLRALTDVPEWCPDKAAQWWETNLPDLLARQPAAAAPSDAAQTEAMPSGARATVV